MGKITINEIHKSLFGYIQAVSDESLETKDKTIVGAINELIQNSNSNKTEINNLTNEISNGKQLIANAIGSPLSSDDTFAAMGNEINQMTIDFRNALAVKGVNAPADKMERLIERIDEIIQSDNVLNIQTMVSGEYTLTQKFGKDGVSTLTVPLNLDFEPDYFVICIPKLTQKSGNELHPSYAVLTPEYPTVEYFQTYMSASSVTYYNIKLVSYDSTSCVLKHASEVGYVASGTVLKWYAIGVREEDTTLSGGLDIISATELPATGKENQICVITSNPTNNYVVTHDYDYSDTTNIILYNGSKNSAPLINIVSGSVTQQYYITKIIQNDKYKLLESYYWNNNQWNSLTKSYVIIVQDGKVQNTNIIGGIKTQSYVMSYDNVSGSLLTPYSSTYSDSYVGATTTKKIDFGKYTTVTITAKVSNGSRYLYVGTATDSGNMAGESTVYLDNFFTKYVSKNLTSTSYVDLTFDISGYTGEYYLAFGFSKASSGGASNVYIKDIKLS